MQASTGRIEELSSLPRASGRRQVRGGWLRLTTEEHERLEPLSGDERIRVFIKELRPRDRCRECACTFGNHSVTTFKDHLGETVL